MPTPLASAAPSLGDIEAFLHDAVHSLAPDPATPVGRGRPRVLPALCLWAGLLVCVLRGMDSQRSLWRLLTQQGLWHYPRFPLSDQAIYNRLARDGTTALVSLFTGITALLHARLAPCADTTLAPFATGVVALDETTLDGVARLLPALRDLPPRDPGLLAGTVTGVFDLRVQQWRHIQYRTDTRQNEKVAARAMVATLPPATLVVADLGYFGFAWCDDLTDAGLWWVSRLRKGTSYDVLHTFHAHGDAFDGLVWLGKHRADRARHAVRLVQFRVGPHLHAYLTNVRDPHTFPPAAVARLYGKRWDFELAVKLVKRELGLHLLWGAKPAVVEAQVWAVLTIAQILTAVRVEVAARAGVTVDEVSLPLLVQWMPRFAAQGDDPIAIWVERGRAAGFIRPSRRLVYDTPPFPHGPPPPVPDALALTRTPRYAGRNCHRNVA